MSDAAPIDKLNFIKCYDAARKALTATTIKSSWRHTGQWPISRAKAHRHPEVQENREKRGWKKSDLAAERGTPEPGPSTPTKSREVREIGLTKSPATRRTFSQAAKAFESLEMRVLELEHQNAQLREENDRLKRKGKKQPLPNPNQGFQTMWSLLEERNGLYRPPPPEPKKRKHKAAVEEVEEEVVEVEVESDEEEVDLAPRQTRRGREIKRPQRMYD